MSEKNEILRMIEEITFGIQTGELEWENRKLYLLNCLKKVIGIEAIEDQLFPLQISGLKAYIDENKDTINTLKSVLKDLLPMLKTIIFTEPKYGETHYENFIKPFNKLIERLESAGGNPLNRCDDCTLIQPRLSDCKQCRDIDNPVSFHKDKEPTTENKNASEIYNEGYIAGYNQAESDKIEEFVKDLLEKPVEEVLKKWQEKVSSLLIKCPHCEAYQPRKDIDEPLICLKCGEGINGVQTTKN